jgi:hypothetical protein
MELTKGDDVDERKMIEEACKREGLTIQGWDPDHENGLTAKLGRYTVTTPDYDDDGLYEGDEGNLTACVVGSEQYNNQRVEFTFIPEDYDSGPEVSDLTALEPVE